MDQNILWYKLAHMYRRVTGLGDLRIPGQGGHIRGRNVTVLPQEVRVKHKLSFLLRKTGRGQPIDPKALTIASVLRGAMGTKEQLMA